MTAALRLSTSVFVPKTKHTPLPASWLHSTGCFVSCWTTPHHLDVIIFGWTPGSKCSLIRRRYLEQGGVRWCNCSIYSNSGLSWFFLSHLRQMSWEYFALTEIFLTLTEVFLTSDWGFSYSDWGFFYSDWGFSHPDWGFSYFDWGFSYLWLRFFLLWGFLTLTEVFPWSFLSCKANSRVKLAKTGHGPHSSTLVVICVVLLLFVLFYILFVCKCVLYYCHRVTTQLQLTNISYILKIHLRHH